MQICINLKLIQVLKVSNICNGLLARIGGSSSSSSSSITNEYFSTLVQFPNRDTIRKGYNREIIMSNKQKKKEKMKKRSSLLTY